MDRIELRYGAAPDIPAFSLAFRAVVEPLTLYNEWARTEELARYAPDKIEDLLATDAQSLLLAYRGPDLAGFLITRPDDGPLWLSWFGVLPSFRGQNIGNSLIKKLIVDAAARGHWKIWCDTREGNVFSIPLLEQNGFVFRCRLERHWYGQTFLLWERFVD